MTSLKLLREAAQCSGGVPMGGRTEESRSEGETTGPLGWQGHQRSKQLPRGCLLQRWELSHYKTSWFFFFLQTTVLMLDISYLVNTEIPHMQHSKCVFLQIYQGSAPLLPLKPCCKCKPLVKMEHSILMGSQEPGVKALRGCHRAMLILPWCGRQYFSPCTVANTSYQTPYFSTLLRLKRKHI